MGTCVCDKLYRTGRPSPRAWDYRLYLRFMETWTSPCGGSANSQGKGRKNWSPHCASHCTLRAFGVGSRHWGFFSKSHVEVPAPAPDEAVSGNASAPPACLASFLSALGITWLNCLPTNLSLFIHLHISLSVSWLISHHPQLPGN